MTAAVGAFLIVLCLFAMVVLTFGVIPYLIFVRGARVVRAAQERQREEILNSIAIQRATRDGVNGGTVPDPGSWGIGEDTSDGPPFVVYEDGGGRHVAYKGTPTYNEILGSL